RRRTRRRTECAAAGFPASGDPCGRRRPIRVDMDRIRPMLADASSGTIPSDAAACQARAGRRCGRCRTGGRGPGWPGPGCGTVGRNRTRSEPMGMCRRTPGVAGVFALLLLAACSDLFGPDREPYEIAGGNGQAGVVGAELASPLVLRVHDRKGRPVEGVVVDWRVEFGEGTVSPVTSATGRGGRATTRWALGAIAGQHRVSAVGEGRVVAPFVAHARPGAAASVRFEADTLYLFVADTTTPRLSVFDRYGNAVRDRPVGLSSAHPGVVGVADDGRVVGRS